MKNCPGYSECLTEFPRPYGPGEQPGKYTYTQSLPKFSEGFLWGMGTAAYQVEGSFKSANRGASIWDTFVGANTTGMPGSACSRAPCAVNSLMAAKGATGNVATNQYKNFRSDVAAMAAIGVPLYRFSVSWPRVIPTGNISEGISWKGLSYYHELVDELLANGIEPMVTLYHWDLPQALLDANHERAIQPCDPRHKQGWFECRWRDGAPEPSGLSSAIAQHFTDFAKLVFSELGPKVRRFATFNEPLTFCWNGAGNGHAPSVAPYIGMPWPMVAAHNVLLSHAAASAALRDMRDRHPELSGAEVGIVLNSDWMEPWSSSPQDISAADLAMQQSLGVFASPLLGPDGDYPNPLKRTLGSLLPQFSAEEKALFVSHRPDFLGLNNYATKFVEACPWSEAEGRFKCPGERGGVNWTGRVLALVNGTLQAVALTRTDGLLRAQSKWQFVAAWGIRKLLNYVHRSYRPRSIIVTENGMAAAASDPEEARSDAQRTAYLFSYLTEINNAVHVDKVASMQIGRRCGLRKRRQGRERKCGIGCAGGNGLGGGHRKSVLLAVSCGGHDTLMRGHVRDSCRGIRPRIQWGDREDGRWPLPAGQEAFWARQMGGLRELPQGGTRRPECPLRCSDGLQGGFPMVDFLMAGALPLTGPCERVHRLVAS